MGRGCGLVAEEGTDAYLPKVADRSADLRKVGDVADTAGWDVVGVAKGQVRNYKADRAGRIASEAMTSVQHDADHCLMVFSDVPYVPYQVEAAESRATAETLVLGKHVEH